MQIIDVTKDNIAAEHICCSITDKKDETCVADKKAWLSQRFDEGLVFKKYDVRGKVFIEYIPAERAWCPIVAPGYMHINCLWVAGQYKGHGYGASLLDACANDAMKKGMAGLTVLSTKRKVPYQADGKFFKKKGFVIADTAPPQFELLYLPFTEDAPVPQFRPAAKTGHTDESGMVIYYSDQCPYTNTYTQRIAGLAAWQKRKLTVHRLLTAEEAQACPAPWTTYAFFYNGNYVSGEIMNERKFETFMEENPEVN